MIILIGILLLIVFRIFIYRHVKNYKSISAMIMSALLMMITIPIGFALGSFVCGENIITDKILLYITIGIIYLPLVYLIRLGLREDAL